MKKLPLKILIIQSRAFRNHGINVKRFLKLTPGELNELDKIRFRELELEYSSHDRRTARIIATLYNCNRSKKNSKTFTEDDFMPEKRSNNIQSCETLKHKVKLIHSALTMQNKA